MNIVVIGMGYVGIPCAALLADVPGHSVTGVQRRSERSGWKIKYPTAGRRLGEMSRNGGVCPKVVGYDERLHQQCDKASTPICVTHKQERQKGKRPHGPAPGRHRPEKKATLP